MIKSQLDYQKDIAEKHAEMLVNPTDKTKSSLKRSLDNWYGFLNITIQVPGNEQKPWSMAETGFPLERMPLKAVSGYNQTGDYHIHIIGEGIDMIGGLMVERKELTDFYGTIGDEENWAKFKREIRRYQNDDRFDTFIIFVECTRQQFMNWTTPEPLIKRKPGDKKTRRPPMSAEHRQNSLNGKHAKLLSLGAPIHWAGTRKEASRYYGFCVRHWILENYPKILGLEGDAQT